MPTVDAVKKLNETFGQEGGPVSGDLRRWFVPLVVLSVLAGLIWTGLFLSFTVDDAFISFRMGKTLLLHHIWNWNGSGPHEEVYTSAVYTVLALIPMALHIPVVVFMKLFGLACGGWLGWRLFRLRKGTTAAILGLLLLSIGPTLWMHMYSCLETPFYMVLLVELALACDRAEISSPAWVYSLALLLPLTRPEGVVFSLAGVLLYRKARGEAGLSRGTGILWAVVFAGAAYFAWRAWYFHHLLPNPFYVKVARGGLRDILGMTIQQGWAYRGYLLAVLLVSMMARRKTTRVFCWTILFLLLALFVPHKMEMNYGDRFYVQLAMPALLIFFLLEDISSKLKVSALAVILFLTAIDPSDVALNVRYTAGINRGHGDIGRRLRAFSANHTLITGDVGMMPYYSDWFTYDMAGLGTNSIAQHGLSVEKLRSMHPDVVILYNATPGDHLLSDHSWVGGHNADAIVSYMNETGDYDYAASAHITNFYLSSFVRKGIPDHDAIVQSLQENERRAAQKVNVRDVLLQRDFPASW